MTDSARRPRKVVRITRTRQLAHAMEQVRMLTVAGCLSTGIKVASDREGVTDPLLYHAILTGTMTSKRAARSTRTGKPCDLCLISSSIGERRVALMVEVTRDGVLIIGFDWKE